MDNVTLEFIAERLARLQAEQAQVRGDIRILRDDIAGFRDQMRLQIGLLTGLGNAQERTTRRMDHLQDSVDLTNKYLTDIILRFEQRLARLEEAT